jgi:hypothetical protein
MDSPQCSSRQPAALGSPATSQTETSAGRPCTTSTPPGSSGSSSNKLRSIADTIGRQLGIPTEAVPVESFGFLGNVFAIDQPATSTLTRERFAWQPTRPSLLDDLEAGHYPA